VLANVGASWVDQTASRFGGALTGAVVDAVPVPQANGRDGVVVGTFAGELEWHANQAGVLTHQANGFAPALGLFALAGIEVGDVAGDARADVVAVSTAGAPRLFVAGNLGFTEVVGAFPAMATGDRLRLADLDRDLDLDALSWTDGQPGLTAWLAHGGSFGPAPNGFLSVAGSVVADVAVVAVDGEPQVVIARSDGIAVQLGWNGSGYGGLRALPWRGRPTGLGLLSADIDRDGDVDVLVQRDHLDPLLLNNEQVHLAQVGLCEAGRASDLRFVAPQPGALAFLLFGTMQVTPTPYGLLRLDPASMGSLFVGVGSMTRETTWRLSMPPGLPPMRLPIQGAWLSPSGAVTFSGLEFFAIAP
jgi:hypothetical protein